MNRMTAIAIYLALTASTGVSVHVQAASTADTGARQTQRAAESVIRCTQRDDVSRAAQPCGVRQAGDAVRLGADVTRQEFDCILSGNCGVPDRGRLG